eukprot:jgi/Bigna1/130693/aug1.12_g5401
MVAKQPVPVPDRNGRTGIHNPVMSRLRREAWLKEYDKRQKAEEERKAAKRKTGKREGPRRSWATQRKLKNGHRASSFCRWLLDTIGKERMQRGWVVDVAGGSGELACQLMLTQIPSVIVDPRPPNWRRTLGRLRAGKSMRQKILDVLAEEVVEEKQQNQQQEERNNPTNKNGGATDGEDAAHQHTIADDGSSKNGSSGNNLVDANRRRRGKKLRKKRKKMKMEEQEAAADPFGGKTLTVEEVSRGPYGPFTSITLPKTIRNPFPLRIKNMADISNLRDGSHSSSSSSNNNNNNNDSSNALPSCSGPAAAPDTLQDALRRASIVVGMHSDQPTEAIIDYGLLTGTPVAVVPCCVFPNLFTERKLPPPPPGKSDVHEAKIPRKKGVRTYKQFCQYLLSKSPELRSERLDFEGRNVVIFYPGRSYENRSECNKNTQEEGASSSLDPCDRSLGDDEKNNSDSYNSCVKCNLM